MRVVTIVLSVAAWTALTLPGAPQSAAPAAGSGAIPDTVAPKTDVQGAGTLSDKLNASGGVIHPQGDVDPAMQKPAPATGTMPVIKPPGSPGSGSDAEPK